MSVTECTGQGIAASSRDRRLGVRHDPPLLDVEAFDLQISSVAGKLRNDGKFRTGVNSFTLAVEGRSAHTTRVEIAAFFVAGSCVLGILVIWSSTVGLGTAPLTVD